MLRFLFCFIPLLYCLSFINFCTKAPDEERHEHSTKEIEAPVLSEEAKLGKELFTKNACHTCHGLTGKGDGPAGQALNPPPRDYKDIESYKQGSTLEEISNTLLTGVPGTSMAPYPHIPEKERRAIAAYVVFLQRQAR